MATCTSGLPVSLAARAFSATTAALTDFSIMVFPIRLLATRRSDPPSGDAATGVMLL